MNQVDAWKITTEDVLPSLVPVNEQLFSDTLSIDENVTTEKESQIQHTISYHDTSDEEKELAEETDAPSSLARKVSFADYNSSIEDINSQQLESIVTEDSTEMAESSDLDDILSISTNQSDFSISKQDDSNMPFEDMHKSDMVADKSNLIIDIEPFDASFYKNDVQPTSETRNILDREFSVEEDTLMVPLQPVQYHDEKCLPESAFTSVATANENNKNVHFGSILRRVSCYDSEEAELISPIPVKHSNSSDSDISVISANLRRVSFPMDDTILTTYKEPDTNQPWCIEKSYSANELLIEYADSCRRHGTSELDIIKQQLQLVVCNKDRSAELNLGDTIVTSRVCETLEDLFKTINFKAIVIDRCRFDADTMRELMNMIEYYESTLKLVVSETANDIETWKSFCNLINKSVVLDTVVITRCNVTETYLRFLVGALNGNVQCVKFDNCVLPLRPNFQLVESLAYNKTIKELYLPQTKLSPREAEYLNKFLSRNSYLQVLDVSNNNLGDDGFKLIADGLTLQEGNGPGLSALFICNNQLTEKSGTTVAKILEEPTNLHTLNISINNITDEAVQIFQNALKHTNTLEGLGLQSTAISCKGVILLAEAIDGNESLQKFNLRGNAKVQVEGLKALLKVIPNSNVIRLEIDPTSKENTQEYEQLVAQIKQCLKENKSKGGTAKSTKKMTRKVSLACEQYYVMAPPPAPVEARRTSSGRLRSPAPSPIPSPGTSPATRSRFQVHRVSEKPATSRFTVTPIDSPEDLPPRRSGTPMPDIDSEISHFMFDSIDSTTPGREVDPIPIVIDDSTWEDSSQSEELKEMDDDYAGDKRNKLHEAAASGNVAGVEGEIEAGQSIDCENAMGWTPLMMATKNGHLAVVKLLLEKGANTTKSNMYGIGLVQLAIASGHLEMVQLTLQHMLSGGISRQNIARKFSPISLAIIFGYEHILHYLVEQSFDVFEDNATDVTPAAYSCMFDNMEAYNFLRSLGAVHNPPLLIAARPSNVTPSSKPPPQVEDTTEAIKNKQQPPRRKPQNLNLDCSFKAKAANLSPLYIPPPPPPPTPVADPQQHMMPAMPMIFFSPSDTNTAFVYSPTVYLGSNMGNMVPSPTTPLPANLPAFFPAVTSPAVVSPATNNLTRHSSNLNLNLLSPELSPIYLPVASPFQTLNCDNGHNIYWHTHSPNYGLPIQYRYLSPHSPHHGYGYVLSQDMWNRQLSPSTFEMSYFDENEEHVLC